MSKQENSLDGAINDPRKAATAEEHVVTLSQDQWTAMRGDAKGIGGGAVGSAAKTIDLEEKHLVIDALKHSGLDRIGRDLTEAEKEKVITSAVRGAESVRDLIDIKHVERALDDEQDRGYIDCFPNFHDLGKGARANDRYTTAIGGGAIGRNSSDLSDGIAGREIPTGDGAIFLPPVDTGDRPIGIVPANRFDPRNPGVTSDTWGSK